MIPVGLRNAGTRAVSRILGIERIGAHTVAIHAVLRDFILRVTQVLTHGKGVVKFVIEAVAHHLLVTRIGIVVRPFVEIGRQTCAIRQLSHRPFFRQPAVITGFRLVLEVGEEGEVCLIVRTP